LFFLPKYLPVPISDIALIARWILPLWLLGWLVFPVSRRLFAFLPDEGLAVGRVGAIVGGALLAFWCAEIGWLPVSVGVWFLPMGVIWAARGWRGIHFREIYRARRGAYALSDFVFLLAFGVFLWVRLRHPSLNDLEKPMDVMLLSASAKTATLPFENPWFAGVSFTNYYFFGPFMGGVLARTLQTPAPLAYNVVQPLFCALFLSVLWNLGAALTRSKWLGVGVMLLVGIGGHLEPIRQLRQGATVGDLDWWKTSRVIPNTINEYPAFTLILGDAHAHFYALCLAVTHFCICLGIVCTQSKRLRGVLVVLGGAMIGVFAITNSWDVPLYALLWAGSAVYSYRKERNDKNIGTAFLWGLVAALIVAGPFLARFQAQLSGGAFALWVPPPFDFLLFWGIWITLGLLAFGVAFGNVAPSREGDFRRLLLFMGVLALLFPCFYYLGGVFAGSDLRHQDTVFKFGLQAWLLGGIAIASEFLLRFQAWQKSVHIAPRLICLGALAVLAGVLFLAPYAVWKARTQMYGEPGLSLDGTAWLPASDRQAILWLRDQNGVVAERLAPDGGGDFDAGRGAVGTLSGLPQVLCWPGSHVKAWGFQNAETRSAPVPHDAMEAQVNERVSDLNLIFTGDAQTRKALVAKLGISFLVVRPNDPPIVDPNFSPHEFRGEDGSKTVVLERSGF